MGKGPTLKQKRAAQLVANGGSIAEVMIEAGYSPTTARTPQKLTESEAWPALMEKELPDDKLLKVHNELLDAVKIVTSPTEPDRIMPDYAAKAKGVELGYKVKRKLDGGGGVQVNILNAIKTQRDEKYDEQ
jgi:hypothetical protein